jgi:hypothetical protein
MEWKTLTVAREFGSGGAEIAALVAAELGWKLLDRALLDEISSRAQVPAADAASLDEHIDPWLHRITRPLWGSGGDCVSAAVPVDVFDAEAAARLARQVILEAYEQGQCVVVGRGSQCVLRGKPGVFHAFVYAPWDERLQRVRSRVAPGTDPGEYLRSMDSSRVDYVRRNYHENRLDLRLYHLMVSSHIGIRLAADVVLQAMGAGRSVAAG